MKIYGAIKCDTVCQKNDFVNIKINFFYKKN